LFARHEPRFDRRENRIELGARQAQAVRAGHRRDEQRRGGARVEISPEHAVLYARSKKALDPVLPMSEQRLDDLADRGIASPPLL
jgi:hypothetical protein